MSAPPTRCCAPATSGRCNNAPAPYGQSRYIGSVEIAACNHPKHQAALRSLPDFQRRDGYCGADDCHKPEPTGICPDHRQLYRRHGVNVRALLATPEEVPVTEPTPPAEAAPIEFVCFPPEATTTDVLSALVGRREQQPSTPDGLAGLAARGQEPAAPGPTLAEVQAELERQRERADRAEMDAIAALLDLEDSPAWDANDQPIPLVERVRAALMPGESWRAAELRARLAAMEQEIADADRILHHLGSYGPTTSLADRLMQVLTPDDRRNILELKASEARFDIARLKARRLNPPPPGRLEEYTQKLAAIEAKLAADHLPDAGKMVQG